MADRADIKPAYASALEGIAQPGRYGRVMASAGVTAREVTGCGLASVIARPDRTESLATAVRDAFGLALPSRPAWVRGTDLSLIWSGPCQWLAVAGTAPPSGMEALLGPLKDHAAIVDQSHGRLILRLTGPHVRDTLAKGLPIDLHHRAFAPGDTAMTVLSHVNVQIWQLDNAPTYDIAIARSFAASVWSWLVSSASEYGLAYGIDAPAGRDRRSSTGI